MIVARRIDLATTELSNPDAPIWRASAARKVNLVTAPVAMQPSKYIQAKWRDENFGQLRELGFQVLHNGTDVAMRLEWRTDAPQHRPLGDNDQFPDAAALLFPLHDDAPIFMGFAGAPVCIWHWKADRSNTAIVNVAEGVGTSRAHPAANVGVQCVLQDGHWQLVFKRRLEPESAIAAHQPRFTVDTPVRVGFAVWDGTKQERAGLKAVSPSWTEFRLMP